MRWRDIVETRKHIPRAITNIGVNGVDVSVIGRLHFIDRKVLNAERKLLHLVDHHPYFVWIAIFICQHTLWLVTNGCIEYKSQGLSIELWIAVEIVTKPIHID